MLFGNKILTYTLSAALFISLVAFQPWLSKNKKEVSLDIMMNSLTSGHYNPKAIDDSLSKHIYHNFLQRMDYSKNLFTKIDLEQLKKYEFKIDYAQKAVGDLNNGRWFKIPLKSFDTGTKE